MEELTYVQRWRDQVSYSQKPENYIPEEHLNPIDVFEYWSKVM
jgi:hypothetical protein